MNVKENNTALKKVQNETQYLTFILNDEDFGLGILNVKEILEFGGITEVPMTPEYIRGVINLRGNVVPIIDLHVRFGEKRKETTKKSCIIIVEVQNEGEMLDIGILVDAVNEVIDIPESDMEPPPQFGSNLRVDFISGMGKVNDEFIIILNQNQVLSVDELSLLNQIREKEESKETLPEESHA